MGKWIKWWKCKTYMSVLVIALLTILTGFFLAYFLDWGWILTIVVTAIGVMNIRKTIIKGIDKL